MKYMIILLRKEDEDMKATTITLLEMKKCLYEAARVKWIEVTGTSSLHEYAYDYVICEEPQIVVRVFTSIQKESGFSRAKGRDAIRICAINITERIGWIKTTKVLRVEGWKKNLIKAINNCAKLSHSRINKILESTPKTCTYVPLKEMVPTQQELPLVTKELRDFIWKKTDDGWCTEASDLDANKENWPRNKCHCGGYYQKKDLINILKTEDEDYEIQGWKFKCPHCNSILTVFND